MRVSKTVFVLRMIITVMVLSASFALNAQDELEGTPDEICALATPAGEPATREYDEPEDVLEDGVDYRAIFCTGVGAIYVDLFEEFTPVTVNSFVFLSQNNYYNNTTFHRVIEDFMAQGGDPTAEGAGGPGYRFPDEYVGFLNFNRPGLLAMANTGQPVTNGSQFFITTSVPDYLNFRHTIFGEVLVGQDLVENIELRDPETATSPGTSLDTVVIITDSAVVEADIPSVEPATIEDAQAILNNLPDIGIPVDPNATGIFTSSEVVAIFSGGLQTQAEALLNDNNHLFSLAISHINASCDLTNIPIMRVKYTLHAFSTRVDATNVIDNAVLVDFITNGNEYSTMEGEVLPHPIYSVESNACNTPATRAITYWQRGRFVAVAEVILPLEEATNAEAWLDQVVGLQVYEFLLTDLLVPEIRDN